jgi:microcystin-dependent protein
MSDSFLGEIRMFAGTYEPQGWKFCNGQSLSINGNEALYSLIGVQYGGDGVNNFALPNLQGRTPIGQGTGTGLTPRTIGQTGGQTAVTLTTSEIPSHTHSVLATTSAANASTPGNTVILATPSTSTTTMYLKVDATDTKQRAFAFDSNAISPQVGTSGQPHNNVMPSYGMNFIICINGLYPSRT